MLNVKGDSCAPLESHYAEAFSNVVAPRSALCGDVKRSAIGFKPVDVIQRDALSGSGDNPFKQCVHVISRFGREDDFSAPHVPRFVAGVLRCRNSANTVSAGIARLGSAFMAS